jgi:phospholipase D3/4
VGAGVLHTKLIMVNGSSFYVGSANTDWRALSMVKELGLHFQTCDALVEDVGKIWAQYYDKARPGAALPEQSWDTRFSTQFNLSHPMQYQLNGIPSQVYFAVSPPQFCAAGRSSVLEALLHTMDQADRFVYISVMDFLPGFLYTETFQYWPVIQDAVKLISINRGVDVRLLISRWQYSPEIEIQFLQSLNVIQNISGIQIRLFTFPPPTASYIDHTHVNHAKYMVTDNTAYIGTNNWTADYFLNTAGIGTVINQTAAILQDPSLKDRSTQEHLRKVFLRDWDSEYARPLPCPQCPSAL